jgi:hypothetical protein
MCPKLLSKLRYVKIGLIIGLLVLPAMKILKDLVSLGKVIVL